MNCRQVDFSPEKSEERVNRALQVVDVGPGVYAAFVGGKTERCGGVGGNAGGVCEGV